MNEYRRTKSALLEIAKGISEHAYQGSSRWSEWSGADVLVTTKTAKLAEDTGFYPEPRTVVTPYAGEVGWLLSQLRDAFGDLLDGALKIEFYGRLADAASGYQRSVN